MFFGREDVFSFVQRNLIGQHRDTPVVLYGQRRTGKTSVLCQLQRHLDPRYRCIFIDLHALSLDGEANLLWGIANSISRGLKRDHQISVGIPDRVTFFADPLSVFETVFLDGVWPALGEDHLVLMLDEVVRLDEEMRAGRLKREVFDYIRHLMQHFERLNFVFSLGSGLEEMKKDYAFLFSVALYRRISFLKPAAARALITQPVRDHYLVMDEAVEKILQITSGHPYYTQLVCHCVFDRWLGSPTPAITVADVDAVLAEAIELGSANLTYVWEDSAPEEQAMMAGMAAVMHSRSRPATIRQVREAWRKVGVSLPEGDVAKAARNLTSREVVAGEHAYSFTVDLQRRWLEKHRRLDWVKEELLAAVREWDRTAEAGPGRRTPALPLEPKRGSAEFVAADHLHRTAEASAGGLVARHTERGGRRRSSRRLLVAAAITLAVVITAAAILLPMVFHHDSVTAAPAVAAVQPDHLADSLLGMQFAATDIPSGTSAFASQLSASLTSLTSSSDDIPEASGLVAAIHTKFSGADDIGVKYYVFDNLGDANSYFSSAPLYADKYRSAGSFLAAGIGDLTKCSRATAPAQLTSWGCLTLSYNVVSYSWVIQSGTGNGVDLESELALDAVRHLQSVAEVTPRAALLQPPGALKAAVLFAKLDSAFPAALVPEGLGTAPTIGTYSNPEPGLIGPNKRIEVTFPGSGADYTESYISIYVFDTAQAAQSWFSENPEPEDPAGKLDTPTYHVPFPPSGFLSSQQIQCNTYSQPAVKGSPTKGVSGCYVQWGNVVLSGKTKISATASNREPGAADNNMGLTLTWAALLRVGQAIGF